MNFQQLEYALAVHRHKHFGQAAESCNITQATLSAMIKKLEGELGLILFDRSRMPVQTTDIGLTFMEQASRMLAQRNEMLHLNRQELNELEGHLTLGVIPTVANSLLPIILPPLLKENPRLKLTVLEITTEEIIHQLKKDKIDLGILATPLEEEQLEETILYYEAMLVYGVTDQRKRYINSKDISGHKIWLLEEGNCFREQSLTICDIKAKDMTATNLQFEGSSFETLLNLTDQFGGYTLIPELYFNNMPEARQQRTKAFKAPIPVREISLVSHRPYAKSQTNAFLAQRIQTLVAGHLTTTQMKARDMEIIGI